eukprot:3469034-Pleurochrysis_carterae.AAC.4
MQRRATSLVDAAFCMQRAPRPADPFAAADSQARLQLGRARRSSEGRRSSCGVAAQRTKREAAPGDVRGSGARWCKGKRRQVV